MSASPEFFKPAPPAFSPPCAAPPLQVQVQEELFYYSESCRTPTGSGITYLREPTTCPPAPRKPPLCRKRLFHFQDQDKGEDHHHQQLQKVPIISLRPDELQRIFRPHPPPPDTQPDKRRRSSKATLRR